uniref:Uncharacterized protein LOC111105800 n=1 Tax=Crassostrea virginica TaxID=6565 RepID=A0A8B8AXJ8_CRAVI|nr:uncharacterized protein LOC111105800 [Crassostrea virginica]
MFWLTILAVIVFSSVCSASNFSSYTISGCSVKLRWNLKNASQYEIYITSQNNSGFQVQITTSEQTYVFVAERQGVNYDLKWTPIYNEGRTRNRGNLSEDHTVYIAKGCNLDSSTSPNIDKDCRSVLKTSTVSNKDTPRNLTASTELDKDCPVHSNSTVSTKSDKGFYVTYFWASAIVFPVVLGGTLLILYFCLIRRPKGTVPANRGGEEARQSVSLNSLCYANNQQNQYCDESYYSMAE